jgi:hypothetical protein
VKKFDGTVIGVTNRCANPCDTRHNEPIATEGGCHVDPHAFEHQKAPCCRVSRNPIAAGAALQFADRGL